MIKLTDEQIDAICAPGRAARWKCDGRQYDRDTVRLVLDALAAPAPNPLLPWLVFDYRADDLVVYGKRYALEFFRSFCLPAGTMLRLESGQLDQVTISSGHLDLATHLARQRAFSEATFGPGRRVAGVCDHIAKELVEIRDSDGALAEWVDVIILALDGALRSGATPEQIIEAIVAKQTKNEGRTWPDWRTADPDKAIEHDRSKDETISGGDDLFADFPPLTPGRITYGTLRAIIEWQERHGIGDVSLATLEACREEGMGAARAGLELGLIDYGQATGQTD